MTQLIFQSNPYLMALALFAIFLLSVVIPYQWGRTNKKLAAFDEKSWNTVQAGLLTLVAFMLGLSYAQAQARFDARRDLVLREANSIGTTWLRADQMTPPDAERFRRILTQYTRGRLEAYSTPNRPDLYARVIHDSNQQQDVMWRLVSSSLREHPANLGLSLLMETLNDTIDISSEQLTALTQHVPTPVIVLTFVLAVIGSISIGFQMGRDKSLPLGLVILYAFALTIVLNLIVDYDRAQTGLVRVALDPIKIQLQSMEP
jgi:hypothetical protein